MVKMWRWRHLVRVALGRREKRVRAGRGAVENDEALSLCRGPGGGGGGVLWLVVKIKKWPMINRVQMTQFKVVFN
jgi:hypothetical protein